jgi:hypothetical protein
MSKPFKRILFTGAAGHLGSRLRGRLHEFADIVRLSDPEDITLTHQGGVFLNNGPKYRP